MMSRITTSALCVLASVLVTAASGPAQRHFITYVDSQGINWGAQPPKPIVDIPDTKYNAVHCGFFLPSLNYTGRPASDFASVVTNRNPTYGGTTFIEQMHNLSVKVILTVGGATELPTKADYFVKNDPELLAIQLAALVRSTGIDGIDLDWEDDYSNQNPGLTGYGRIRTPGGGPAVKWLITLTNKLRLLLPRSEGFLLSHAPQAPYFDLGYEQVFKGCGDDIDYLNIQFYNQGEGAYTTAAGLVDKESIHAPGSAVKVWDGSITDLVAKGVPSKKIVVGKTVNAGDGQSGNVPVDKLVPMLEYALEKFPDLAGVFGWQWGSDTQGKWIQELSSPFKALISVTI